MTTFKSFKLSLLLLICSLSAGEMWLQPAQAQAGLEEMSTAANNFLAALTPAQKAKAVYEFKSEERQNWHFIPKARNGLPMKEMTPAQQRLAFALLASGMSQRGTSTALSIMSMEQVLHDMENNSPKRDPEMYYFTIFGDPDTKAVWGWRVEGHHLSANFTLAKTDEAFGTPCFFGSNPGEVMEGPRKGLRLLGHEEDLGRKIVKSLSPALLKKALIDVKAPKEVITAAERKVKPLPALGVSFSELNQSQQADLRTLIKLYVQRVRPEIADKDLAKIEKAGYNKILFAWAGGLDRGQPHYYRVQGPTFLLEYDNTQNNANHVHAVWRDFDNDFGEDVLLKHYQQYSHK